MIKFNLFNIFTPKPLQLFKPVQFHHYNGRYYIDRLPARFENGTGLLTAYVTDSERSCRTEFKSQKNKKLGYHDYKLLVNCGFLEGDYIEVDKHVRNKGIGEVLKLASLIEMKKNNLDKMTLYSLPEAIKFHAKFGFVPDINSTAPIPLILSEIKETNLFKDLSAQASGLLDSISAEFINYNNLEKVNNFLTQYINRCISENKPVFNKKICMVLTKDRINSNADFYNNLFEKHGINFNV